MFPASKSIPNTDSRLVTARATNDGGATGGGVFTNETYPIGFAAGERKADAADPLAIGAARILCAATGSVVVRVLALIVTVGVLIVVVVSTGSVFVEDDFFDGTVCCSVFSASAVGAGFSLLGGAGSFVGTISVSLAAVVVGVEVVGVDVVGVDVVVCEPVRVSVVPPTVPWADSVDDGSEDDPEPDVTELVEPVVVWVPVAPVVDVDVVPLVVPGVDDSDV